MNAEQARLAENNTREKPWYFWGPYLAERAWGTVREDYSANGDAWNYFPHEHARSRAYRWNEDGLGGICDHKQHLCFAFAFWNERDPILKERLFGLTGPQGNHGEDVKEVYWYTDNTPTHSLMRMLYRYPQAAFPYQELVSESARRSRLQPEYEIWETGVLAKNRYFDIEIEYAKAGPYDILVRINATNCGPEPAVLHLLPTIWFRNTWSWGRNPNKPILQEAQLSDDKIAIIEAQHPALRAYRLFCEKAERLLFTENETNLEKLYGVPNQTPYVKDSIHDAVVHGAIERVNANRVGTKAAAHYRYVIPPRKAVSIRLRLARSDIDVASDPFREFDNLFLRRSMEAEAFYGDIAPSCLSPEQSAIQRQALAGMLWSKQFYHYIIEQWLQGDLGQPPPPPERLTGRNCDWRHLYNETVMSMPDAWEYPWYAAWDLGFHCIPLALVDPAFAKEQLDVIVREWYQHPNGHVPAYEWNFSDVNPPVLAWAAYRVFQIERKQSGQADYAFLETVFHKMLIAFTWWVNRKDSEGRNIFQGGFLGLDNVGVFDRNAQFSDGTRLEQSDGTSWMGMFSLNLMRIALELARKNPVYENIATKFFEHFLGIAAAMNNLGGTGIGLWDEEEEFFYDVLHTPGGRYFPLRVRSIVGLMPLLATETLEPELLNCVPGFKERLEWYLTNRPDLASLVSRWQVPGAGDRRLVALTRGHRMKCILRRMLDPDEFLSPYGIRSMSKYHKGHPYVLHARGEQRMVGYEPGDSQTGTFGGNSNWRGPIWFPINYLLIESLQKFHHYYGDDFKVECPTRSGKFLTLKQIANDLSNRLIHLWMRDEKGNRPYTGASPVLTANARDDGRFWFHEFFHGDTGAGLGASHQTGWTGLIAKLILQQGDFGTITKRDPFSDI